MKRFLDSGVLISAWRGLPSLSEAALEVMSDDRCTFVSAENVRLEVLPKPVYGKQRAEVEFYEAHFAEAESVEPFSRELGEAAFALARIYGLSAGDALNISAAIRQGADEFVTSETPGKPMFRVREILVVSLHAAAGR